MGRMPELDDDAITVTLPAEEGGAVITKVESVDAKNAITADDPILDLKGQFETLKGQLNQTTQRLVGAERQLADKDQEIATVRKEVTSSQLDTVLSGIQAAEAEATAAEREYVAAAEAGDFAAQARAQRKISGAEARIQRLKEAEGDLKDQASTKPAKREEPPQQPSGDPVERFTQGMSPKSAAWIRSHPDCVTDAKKHARMLAAHNLAMADDVAVDSPEYFERIEAGIMPAKKVEAEPNPKPVNIRPSAPVAPTGNSGGGMNGGGLSVKLTQREVNSATDGTLVWNYNDPNGKFKKGDVIGVQEMGRRKLLMQKQGHYDKQYTE
jgi:hypothetical protein